MPGMSAPLVTMSHIVGVPGWPALLLCTAGSAQLVTIIEAPGKDESISLLPAQCALLALPMDEAADLDDDTAEASSSTEAVGDQQHPHVEPMSSKQMSSADALTSIASDLAALLLESTQGCKQWAQDHGNSVQGDNSPSKPHAAAAGTHLMAAESIADCSEQAASDGRQHAAAAPAAARQWWQWRHKLDQQLGDLAARLHQLASPALQHCLPKARKTTACAPAGVAPDAGAGKATRQAGAGNGYTREGDGSVSDAAQHCAAMRPLLLLMSQHLHKMPWESLPCLADFSVFRALHHAGPLASAAAPAAKMSADAPDAGQRLAGAGAGSTSASSKAVSTMAARCAWHQVDPSSAVYVVDPQGDLGQTRLRFERWFAELPGWCGSAGAPALSGDELHQELAQRQLFVYLGHGAGASLHLPLHARRTTCIAKHIAKAMPHSCKLAERLWVLSPAMMRSDERACAASGLLARGKVAVPVPVSLLMGCSSGRLKLPELAAGAHQGCAVTGAVASCLRAGSPCVVANLWDVTDKDIDMFTTRLLTQCDPNICLIGLTCMTLPS